MSLLILFKDWSSTSLCTINKIHEEQLQKLGLMDKDVSPVPAMDQVKNLTRRDLSGLNLVPVYANPVLGTR